MSRIVGAVLTVLFMLASSITSSFLWATYGQVVGCQILLTLLIASVGEHIVSGQGYYYYTRKNGIFVGLVPVWIPFMWVFAVQISMITALAGGLTGFMAAVGAGIVGMLADLTFVEPLMCRMRRLWVWKSVERGYFSFIPRELNRFTAPPGNYIVWFLFPFLMNLFLVLISGLMA